MGAVARHAERIGASRVQWESGEAEAIRFYDALGDFRSGKVHFALPADRLAELRG
ncbi:MAG: hypothetical protein ACU0CO_06900 [Shimia sp.]